MKSFSIEQIRIRELSFSFIHISDWEDDAGNDDGDWEDDEGDDVSEIMQPLTLKNPHILF